MRHPLIPRSRTIERPDNPPAGWLCYDDGTWVPVNAYGIPGKPFVSDFDPIVEIDRSLEDSEQV